MPEITFDLDLICNSCGNDLYVNLKKSFSGYLMIEPCEHCLEEAEENGYDRGNAENKEGGD